MTPEQAQAKAAAELDGRRLDARVAAKFVLRRSATEAEIDAVACALMRAEDRGVRLERARTVTEIEALMQRVRDGGS
jgi:hypothetical protein